MACADSKKVADHRRDLVSVSERTFQRLQRLQRGVVCTDDDSYKFRQGMLLLMDASHGLHIGRTSSILQQLTSITSLALQSQTLYSC